MAKYVCKSKYFCGNKISDYGLEQGYVDYATLAKSFDCVLNNDIIAKLSEHFYFELVNGSDYNEEDDYYYDIFQYYIISESGYRTLSECTDEIVYYCEELNLYVWGVTHWGTSWDYVLTDIPVEL